MTNWKLFSGSRERGLRSRKKNCGLLAYFPGTAHGLRSDVPESAVRICDRLPTLLCRSTEILPFLVRTAIRLPKLTAAVALALLAAVAGTMAYTGFLVVGVLADQLGTGRFVAGLLLGALFARFPWISNGRPRIVGLLPKPVRRPLIVAILALCLAYFGWQGDYVSAWFIGLTTAFFLTFPWLRRVIFDRLFGAFFKFTRRNPAKRTDDTVIDGEFRERKE